MRLPAETQITDATVMTELERHAGDPWAAVRALLHANEQLEIELEATRALLAPGCVLGASRASESLH